MQSEGGTWYRHRYLERANARWARAFGLLRGLSTRKVRCANAPVFPRDSPQPRAQWTREFPPRARQSAACPLLAAARGTSVPVSGDLAQVRHVISRLLAVCL